MLNRMLLAISLCVFAGNAYATNIMTCNELEIYQQEQNGNSSFQPTGVSVEISHSNSGKFGFVAKYISANGAELETDVNVGLEAPDAIEQLKELTALMYPHMNWTDVAKVRVGNVGVTANREDSAGFMIFELVDTANAVLGKVAQAGWSFGRCR